MPFFLEFILASMWADACITILNLFFEIQNTLFVCECFGILWTQSMCGELNCALCAKLKWYRINYLNIFIGKKNLINAVFANILLVLKIYFNGIYRLIFFSLFAIVYLSMRRKKTTCTNNYGQRFSFFGIYIYFGIIHSRILTYLFHFIIIWKSSLLSIDFFSLFFRFVKSIFVSKIRIEMLYIFFFRHSLHPFLMQKTLFFFLFTFHFTSNRNINSKPQIHVQIQNRIYELKVTNPQLDASKLRCFVEKSRD